MEELKVAFFAETWIGSGVNIRPADCISEKVDNSYLFGYYLPDVFQDTCPNSDRYKRNHAGSQTRIVLLHLVQGFVSQLLLGTT